MNMAGSLAAPPDPENIKASALPDEATPVELEQFTTETTQVLRQPSGTLELTSHREAVRVEQDGEWVDIDTTLATRNGRVAPTATTADLTFSAGGTGPLVTMGAGDEAFSVAWEDALPRPKIDGSQVTYAQVRAGVDLVMNATPSGFTQTLVIHSHAAAKELATVPAQLVASSEDLTFFSGNDGDVIVKNADGDVAFTGAPPVMWDSSGAETPSAQDPQQARITPADAEIAAQGARMEVSLAPAESVLADPTTTYPLFLDPAMTRNGLHYLTVHENGWDYYDDANQDMRVGYCGWQGCNASYQANANSFFSFDISALAYKGADPEIYDATVTVKQVHNATSASQPVNLHRATVFTAGTNYPGPRGAQLQQISSAAGWSTTANANLSFSSAEVRTYIQSAATSEGRYVQFALSAPTKDNLNQWKKFGNNPGLTVKYGFAPTKPTLDISNAIECGTQPRYVPGQGVTLKTTASTQGPGGNTLNYVYELYKAPFSSGQAPLLTRTNLGKPSGSWDSWPIGTLASGQYRYRVQARVNDSEAPNTPGPWSDYYTFNVDTTAPGNPSIFSPTHPQGAWGAASNASTRFDVTASDGPAGYAWAVGDASDVKVPTSATCGYSSTNPGGKSGYVAAGSPILIGPNVLSVQGHTISVRSFDHAHNVSGTSTYKIVVAPNIGGDGKNLIELEDAAKVLGAGVSATKVAWPGTGGFASLITAPASLTSRKVEYKFSTEATGYHALGLRYGLQSTGAAISLSLTDPGKNDTPEDDTVYRVMDGDTPRSIDTAGSATRMFRSLSEYLPQDGVLLTSGRTYTLTVELSGSGSVALIDSLVAAPIRNGTYDSLSAAFDNQAIGYSSFGIPANRFALGSGASGSFHHEALTAMGFDQNNTLQVGPALFTLPQRPVIESNLAVNNQSIVADNAVSMGQTIKLPAVGDSGSAIYLLAAATCGPIVEHPSRQLTIGYTVFNSEEGKWESATSDEPVREVPNWTSAATPPSQYLPAALTTPTHLMGLTPVTENRSMYVLRFPIDPMYVGDEIAQVTLPQIGTNFSNVSCGQPGSQALHVFGMSVGQ